MPSLAAHIIQDKLRSAGIQASILYTSLIAAKVIGFDLYHTLAESTKGLVCERLISLILANRNHPNVPGNTSDKLEQDLLNDLQDVVDDGCLTIDDWSLNKLIESIELAENQIFDAIQRYSPKLVAFTTTFQTITSVEMISEKLKKEMDPPPHIVAGGSNAEGEMAEGLATFFYSVDHIFSGEVSEDFISYCKSPKKWSKGVTHSSSLSPPHKGILDFDEFYKQANDVGHPRMASIWIPLETSKGCWFGEKSHCTFCGLNGAGMLFRSKPANSALEEYKHYRDKYRPMGFFMVDNIIPRHFFSEFLPKLAEQEEKPDLFYEVKSNLTFSEISLLKASGASSFQPGIEALSTPLLKHMKKGTSAYINLRTLFWAKQVRIRVAWNLLAHFPNDEREWYEETLSILPYIRHLQPPQQAVSKVSVDRFSPLFTNPSAHNISNIRPVRHYHSIFGGTTDIQKIAYHFEADFNSEYTAELDEIINKHIFHWKETWTKNPASLEAFQLKGRSTLIVDTRCTINTQQVIIDKSGALLNFIQSGEKGVSSDQLHWLLEKGLVLSVENRIVNLVEKIFIKSHGELLLPFLPLDKTNSRNLIFPKKEKNEYEEHLTSIVYS